MSDEKVYLKRADYKDIDLLYKWANDPITRGNAFHSETIVYNDHVEWFRRVMQSPCVVQLLMFVGEEPVGQIRLDIVGAEAEVDYSIAMEYRGCGYGKKILELGMLYAREHLDIEKLTARVKKVISSRQDVFWIMVLKKHT